jgi:genome maintenance exonuclease 1
MSFIHHNFLGNLELEKKEENGIRLYHLPNGNWVPSITTVTGNFKKEKILEWRKRVGEEKANQISRKASARGTDFHQVCQDYLENKELVWQNYKPLTKFMFFHAKPYLDKINNIHAIERTLYSEYFGVAGRVDCIAEYEGELAVIDFKTSDEIKPEEWIENYFVQEMFYATAYYELTEIPPVKLITIMVTPNGDVKIFDKRNKGDYIKLLIKYIKKFVKDNFYEGSNLQSV